MTVYERVEPGTLEMVSKGDPPRRKHPGSGGMCMEFGDIFVCLELFIGDH